MVYMTVGISCHHRRPNFGGALIDGGGINTSKYIRWKFIITPISPFWSSEGVMLYQSS